MTRSRMSGAVIALCLSAGAAAGVTGGAHDLLATFPGVSIHDSHGRVLSVYGAPMTAGATAEAAAAAFLQQHGDAFGEGIELSETWQGVIGEGRFTAFWYAQWMGGLPVEGALGRVLVLNGETPRVVYAAGKFAAAPAGGLPAASVPGHAAVTAVRAMPEYKALTRWSAPSMVVYAGPDAAARPVRAWKFIGEVPELTARRKLTFFVDASSGALAGVRDEVHSIDVTGKVEGKATPGTFPDIPSNPPVATPIPGIRASLAGAGSAYTLLDGTFVIPHPGNAPINATTKLGNAPVDGIWVHVENVAGAELSQTKQVTPPGPVPFDVFNNAPTAANTAQVNAFIHTNLIHNYFKDRAPSYTGLDTSIRANVNLADTCNAFFDGNSINFYAAGGGCVNTSYTSVVAHEYGHFVVQQLGLEQGAFGEGYSDTCAVLLYDEPIVGKAFYTNGDPVRDIVEANMQYPCQSFPHDCGQVLAGVWWDARQNLGGVYGSDVGLAIARQHHVDWSLITIGGLGNDAAHPQTAIEVLTIDDNDGNLENGTPNYGPLCAAFDAHNIPCPVLKLLKFDYPSGLPDDAPANQPIQIAVHVTALNEQPEPGTGEVTYRIDGGPFTTIAMAETGSNKYVASIPAGDCPGLVEYYFSAGTAGGGEAVDPPLAPGDLYATVIGALEVEEPLSAGFSAGLPPGWTATGLWHVTSSCSPGPSCDGGSFAYYGNDNVCNYDTGAANSGMLTAPAVALPAVPPGGKIELRYCSNLQGESGGLYDRALVTVNGVTVDEPDLSVEWQTRTVDLSAYGGQTVTLRFTFDTVDSVLNEFNGWQVDGVSIAAVNVSCATCYADCEADGDLDIDDFVCFQTMFAFGDAYADCEQDNDLDIDDFICFQTLFALGCP